MKTPIVITAFGTTTKALKTYSFINKILYDRFQGHDLLWAYSSRMVKDRLKKNSQINLIDPNQVLRELEQKGHKWAVVQSLHLICGHEFYRLAEEARTHKIRTSMGLPLLSDPEDYERVVKAFVKKIPNYNNSAIVLVGHGTDHPGWSSYLALQHIAQAELGQNLFMGVLEEFPGMDRIVEAVKRSGFQSVHLVPFLLVAGTHFQEDIIGNDNSWKTAFEKLNIEVSYENKGLGFQREIIDIFCDHIQEAMDYIPNQEIKTYD